MTDNVIGAMWLIVIAMILCGTIMLDSCASDPRATPPDCRGVAWCFS